MTPNFYINGINPIIVDKKTGKSRSMSFFDEEDKKIYYSATKIDIPKEFLAWYLRGKTTNDED